MSSLEAKREQFRKYLERCGVIDALSKALIKLYEETNKPDDAVRYVRKYMCESCPDDEQFDVLKSDLKMASKTIQDLEEELERYKGNLKRTTSEIALLLEEGFKKLEEDADCKSLLKKYFTKEIFDELALSKTSNGATLLDIIQCGLDCHGAPIGAYAADKESYDIFKTLLEPIIKDYHKQDGEETSEGVQLQGSVDWGDIESIKDLDPDSKFILSTRIRIARNVDGYPFFSKIMEEPLKELEGKVKEVLEGLEGEHKGKYYSLRDLDIDVQAKMIARKILFKKGDPFLAAAAAYRFWPTGRGVFHNPAETFIVWVNSEDHLRIISMGKCGDLGDVYSRLVAGEKKIGENLQFQHLNSYGFVTSSLSNLGTGMHVSVIIKLPLLARDMTKLEERCDRLNLKIVTVDQGKASSADGTMEISNKRCMGVTEFQVVKDVQDGVLELIKAEEDLTP